MPKPSLRGLNFSLFDATENKSTQTQEASGNIFETSNLSLLPSPDVKVSYPTYFFTFSSLTSSFYIDVRLLLLIS